MKMDLCRALSTLYTSVMSVLPDRYGMDWGISGVNLLRNDSGSMCQLDIMFVGMMDDRRTAFEGCYKVWYNICSDSLECEMLFIDGVSARCCCTQYITGCLCATIRFFLDQVDDSGELYYRVCNTLGEMVEYAVVGYQHALKTGTVTVECNIDNVRYLTVPRKQLFFFNFYKVNNRVFESKFYEIKREAIEKYGPDINVCKTSKEVLDVCCIIESTEEIFLESALSVLVQRIIGRV